MLFINKVFVDSSRSVADQLRNLLRGQWVFINGFSARIVNHAGDRVTVMFSNRTGTVDVAVFK